MTTPYGLDQGQMQNVINQTNEAIQQMTTLNAQVQSRAGDVYAHAQSDAGRIIEQRLMTWNSDFTAIVNALIDLNGTVQQWMHTSAQTATQGSSAAGGGSGAGAGANGCPACATGSCHLHAAVPATSVHARTPATVTAAAPAVTVHARTPTTQPVLKARAPMLN